MPKKETNLQRLARENRELRADMGMQQLAAGELTTSQLTYVTQIATEKPDSTNTQAVFTRCRYWARESSLLKMYMALRASVANFGFSIRAVEKKDQEKIEEWLKEELAPAVDTYKVSGGETVEIESNSTIAEAAERFVRSCWKDKFTFSNVVASWSDGNPQPIVLNIENCIYTDTFGVELLQYTHGLSGDAVNALPDDLKKAFKKPTIYVNPKIAMHFKVWKPGAIGSGFSTPDIYSLFRLLGEIESKEFGQHALGFACRSVKRAHLLGHEIKAGVHAGKPIVDSMWNKKRSDALLRKWVNIVGFEDYTCNYDEDVKFWLPDPKLFDEIMWLGSDRRFSTWGGPLMQMFFAKGASPYLTNLLKAEVTEERRAFTSFLTTVLNKSFEPPAPIKVAWSNSIFAEARIAAEMLKFGKQYGVISSGTLTEEIGFSPEIERDRKLAEVDDPDARKLEMPSYDAAHNTSPALGDWEVANAAASAKAAGAGSARGQEAGKTPGRKPGTPNA